MRDGVILGIETSCDDTAAAVVAADGRVLSSVIAGQTEIHTAHGGVYPELASRAHSATIIPTVHRALEEAGVHGPDLVAIGVTRGPGLIGSLLVGLNAAQGLSLGWGVRAIGVNHLRGHLRSVALEGATMDYPALVLLVSGGHTLLARMDDARTIAVLGSTRDDSVGEAYDKVGRMLGTGFPGGPGVDRLAAAGEPSLALPRPLLNEGYEFSFSGLKSAVARTLAQTPAPRKEDVAASFGVACLDVLVAKCRRALKAYPAKSLAIVGGVAASAPLRARFAALCAEMGVELRLPPLRWSTDNAAMIALAAWDYLELPDPPKPVAQTRIAFADY